MFRLRCEHWDNYL